MGEPASLFCCSCAQKFFTRAFYEAVLYFRKLIFPHTAQGTYPIIGNVLKFCAGRNSIVQISRNRVIHITTDITDIFFHDSAISFSNRPDLFEVPVSSGRAYFLLHFIQKLLV